MTPIIPLAKRRKIRSKFFIVQNLSPEEKKELSQTLYDLTRKLFGNLDYNFFNHTFFGQTVYKTYLGCCYNEEDIMVGFFCLQVHLIKLEGKENMVFRGQTGLLPEYRRKTASIFYLIFLIILYRIRFPFKAIRCFLIIMNPGMYATLAGMMKDFHPGIRHKITAQDNLLMKSLRKEFFPFKNDHEHRWLVQMGLHSLFTEKEIDFYANSANPHIKFYLKMNAEYENGYGLMTHIPFTWSNIIFSAYSVLKYLTKRTFRQVSNFQNISFQFK